MLFNSYAFILGFFPIVFIGFFQIGKYSSNLALLWLAIASLFFYGWWDARFVGLLAGSIVFNYGAAYLIGRSISGQEVRKAKMLLIGSIAANLLLLGYFKYARFFADNFNQLAGTALSVGDIILPLGISFFTFTQIAFLADTYQGKAKEYNFVHYTLFVTYFPHLIAGPVLHHREMMPQFAMRTVCTINWENVAAGLAIFVLGLAKKALIADSLGEFASPIFNAAGAGGHPMLIEAWVGALAYTLQLYFDFSAYSDMAIGLSLMLNVRLPMNFNSPYKATSIIEFWRRWHMTLSRFLRDYLYVPLGGNRNGKRRRYLNLMITMLLGGLWHGAGWTFVIWGGLHGLYLVLNQAYRALKRRLGWHEGGRLARVGAGALTFLAVVIGWVFFRADSVSSAFTMLRGMMAKNGVVLPGSLEGMLGGHFAHQNWLAFGEPMPLASLDLKSALFTLAIGFAIAWGLPDVRQLFLGSRPTTEDFVPEQKSRGATQPERSRLGRFLEWHPSRWQGATYGMFFVLLLIFMRSAGKSEFLYFQF